MAMAFLSGMIPIFNTYTNKLVTMYRDKIVNAQGGSGDSETFWLQLPVYADFTRLVSFLCVCLYDSPD